MLAHRMFSIIIVAAVFVATSSSILAKPTTYHVRAEDSNIGFTIYKWVVFKEEGRFRDYSGSITYDAGQPSATAVDFSIKTGSVDSRNGDRDGAIKSPDLLHSARYPLMTFKSTSARSGGKDTLLVTGDFTIRDITKRITVPVRILGTTKVGDIGELIGFETTFTIDRNDYGIAPGMTMIGNEVTIHMMIGAASGGASARR
ncbi:MAG: YceI family protein [Bacteroidota bacterium]